MIEQNAEQIQAVIQAQELIELRAEIDLLVNDFQIETKISGFDLFCQKTGHKIGTRNENSLLDFIKICGKENASGNIYDCTSLNVHPAWLDSSPEYLDILIDTDPIGYACYCFSVLTQQFYQDNENSIRFRQRKSNDARKYPCSDRYWALARANAIMQERGAALLSELNLELARTISFMPDAGAHLFIAITKFGNTPDKLAQLHCSGELITKLREATNRTLSAIGTSRAFSKLWIERTRFIDLAASPQDAARGPSNIRRQRVSKRQVADAVMFNEIDKMFAAQGFNLKESIISSGKVPNTTAWIEKQKAREAEIAIGLAALEGFTNLTFTDENDEDDNSVEVRTLAAAPVGLNKDQTNNEYVHIDIDQTQSGEVFVTTIPTVRKLTAMEILRAKRGMK